MKKINSLFSLIISLPKTIFFNFHYLPFKQAILLPIWLYNVKLKKVQGSLHIESEKINFGMIKLGPTMNALYENCKSRFIWEQKGKCIFRGDCIIGNNSAITIGKNGTLIIGNNARATTSIKVACYDSIFLGDNIRIAWETIIMDTDFHQSININTSERSLASKKIVIGKNNWIGLRSIILKGTVTPDFCIVGANSLLNKKYDIPSYCMIAGNPAKLVKTGIYRDLNSNVE